MNDPDHSEFRTQVEWELDYQTKSDILVYYFAADTLSPVTLLELGLFKDKNPVVGASKSYQRYGNLVIAAEYHSQILHSVWGDFVAAIHQKIHTF